MRYTRTLILLCGLASAASHANLLLNPSFETVPGVSFGQGIMPSEWVNIAPPTPTADTYSNDGSYGLSPANFDNFTGVTAHDGIRWVAGWSDEGQESFGQWLSTPLTAGTDYELSGWLHQSVRFDNPGGYEVYLTDTPGVQSDLLGFLGSTTGAGDGWQQFSFTFTATMDLASLAFIEFAPIATGSGSAYPGLDMVSLSAIGPGPEPLPVPAPATAILLLPGLLLLRLGRRR